MATYEAITQLHLANGKTVEPGEKVDARFIRDVGDLVDQGHVVLAGEEPTVEMPPPAYVEVDLAVPGGVVQVEDEQEQTDETESDDSDVDDDSNEGGDE
jgi:hypothetical protein